MRILVANNAAPFVRGGAEMLAERLVRELVAEGHEAELWRLPLGSAPDQMTDSMIAASLTRLEYVDRVIGLKFPAYLVPHENKVIWLVHQLRQAYEPPPVGWVGTASLGPFIEAVHSADDAAFRRARSVYAISPVVAERLRVGNAVQAPVLLTPPHTDTAYRHEDAEGYIVALGRIGAGKRQWLAVEAMAHTRPGFRLVVAGPPDTPESAAQILRRVEQLELGDRVEVIPRFIDEDEKVDLLARCSGSVYLPIDEDSYGYVCYEAAMARKPTITATDSGGTHTLVHHGTTGLVVAPEPVALADAMAHIAANAVEAKALGERAHAAAVGLQLSWERVVEELTR